MAVLAPTRLPQIDWTSDTTLTITPHLASYDSRCVLAFNDGISRSFSGTLTVVNNAAAGEGSMDLAPVSSSTWYYIYLVPSAADDSLVVGIASREPPLSGPYLTYDTVRYDTWRYIGCVWVDSGSDWAVFGHVGPVFHRGNFQDTAQVFHQDFSSSNGWYAATISTGMFPILVARSIMCSLALTDSSAADCSAMFHADGDSTPTGTTTTDYKGQSFGCHGNVSIESHGHRNWIPIHDDDTKIWGRVYGGANTVYSDGVILYCEGWYDKYLIE